MANEIIHANVKNSSRAFSFTPIGNSWDGAKVTNTQARRLVDEIDNWARQFNAPDAEKLSEAMCEMKKLFSRVWTEIDEALSLLATAESRDEVGDPVAAKGLREGAMLYLHRWQDRSGRIGNVG